MKKNQVLAMVIMTVLLLTGCGNDVTVESQSNTAVEPKADTSNSIKENDNAVLENEETGEKLLAFDLTGAGMVFDIAIDGKNIVDDDSKSYKGFGAILSENQVYLLSEYKEQSPEVYDEILEIAFGNESGITSFLLPDATVLSTDSEALDDEEEEDQEEPEEQEEAADPNKDLVSWMVYLDACKFNDSIELVYGDDEKTAEIKSGAMSPIGEASLLSNHDVYGTGLTSSQGILDVTGNIVGSLSPDNNAFYISPYINASFPGEDYRIGGIIQAKSPFAGDYSINDEYLVMRHISGFAECGWRFVDEANSDDSDESSEEIERDYLVLVSPDKENATIVIVNNTSRTAGYNIDFDNIDFTDRNFNIWESRGYIADESEPAYLNRLGATKANDNKLSVFLKPFSVITLTTTDNKPDLSAYETSLDKNQNSSAEKKKYTYDFGYDEDAKDITGGMEGRFTYGDVSWTNVDVTLNAHLVPGGGNNGIYDYIGLGSRCNIRTSSESGYSFRIYENSKVELLKDGDVVYESEMSDLGFSKIDTNKWYEMRFVIKGRKIKTYLNGYELFTYVEEGSYNTSGVVTVVSSCDKNYFGELNIKVIDKKITQIDDFDKSISYSSELDDETSTWEHNSEGNFRSYNATESQGGFMDSFSFEYEGEDFSLIGRSSYATLDIQIDDNESKTIDIEDNSSYRKCIFSSDDLEAGNHRVKVVITGGNLTLDAIEY